MKKWKITGSGLIVFGISCIYPMVMANTLLWNTMWAFGVCGGIAIGTIVILYNSKI